jgi:anti-anti-sigma factor
MKISVKTIDPRTVLAELEGRLNIDNAPAFEKRTGELLEKGPSVILLGMSRVTQIDSSGWGVLTRLVNTAKRKNQEIVLLDLPQEIHRSMGLLYPESFFTIRSSETREE